MTQHTMKKGLELFREAGVKAVLTEMKQLHNHDVMESKLFVTNKLSCQEKCAALQYLMFLKKKCCGRVKAQGCADLRKQQAYINKEDASAPTAATKSVMLMYIIDVAKQHDGNSQHTLCVHAS